MGHRLKFRKISSISGIITNSSTQIFEINITDKFLKLIQEKNIAEDFVIWMLTDFNKDDVIDQCLKIEVNVPADKMDEIEDIIKDDFNYDKHGTENAFEIYSNVISKATGVQKVLEHLNLNHQDSYAFGDGLNDLEMIQLVGTGVAMGNAVPELKEVSDLVCDTIQNNGLEKVLVELFD